MMHYRTLLLLALLLGLMMALRADTGTIVSRDHPDPTTWPGYTTQTPEGICTVPLPVVQATGLTPAQQAAVAVLGSQETITTVYDRDFPVPLDPTRPVALTQFVPVEADAIGEIDYLALSHILTPQQFAQLPACGAVSDLTRLREMP